MNYISRLGRNPAIAYVLPAALLMPTGGYLAMHTFQHDLIIELFGVTDTNSSTGLVKMSSKLKDLIGTVMTDIGDTIGKDPLERMIGKKLESFMKKNEPYFKWFVASTHHPVTFGFEQTPQGCLIGLPEFMNYSSLEDVPSSALRLKYLRHWKPPNEAKVSGSLLENYLFGCYDFTYLNPNTDASKSYLSALVLSDDAKKFVIAREVYMADLSRPIGIAFSFMLSAASVVGICRHFVDKFRLKEVHLRHRLMIYTIGLPLFGVIFATFGGLVNQTFTTIADNRALQLGEAYRKGAEEYFEKELQRHRALVDLQPTMDEIFDENGDPRHISNHLWIVPPSSRLQCAKRLATQETKEKSTI